MSTEEIIEPTYIEIICEVRLNPTENREFIEKIMSSFLEGEIREDKRFDGLYLIIRNSSMAGLQKLGDWIRQFKLLDTVRRRLRKSITGNITAIYFNRQAAAMGKLSLVDVDDNPPLGYIAYQIVSDGLEFIIDQFTPKTYDGHEISAEEFKRRKQEKREEILHRKNRKEAK